MATAHGILTWGPAGITREGQAWPQRDGWSAEDRVPGALWRPGLLCGPVWAHAAIYNSAEWAQ